jgi:hydrogenase expression/formation protein HypC
MCLAIPACVEQLIAGDSAIVNLGGVRKEISMALVEDVAVGDYVIVHVGFALQTRPEKHRRSLFAEIGETLRIKSSMNSRRRAG